MENLLNTQLIESLRASKRVLALVGLVGSMIIGQVILERVEWATTPDTSADTQEGPNDYGIITLWGKSQHLSERLGTTEDICIVLTKTQEGENGITSVVEDVFSEAVRDEPILRSVVVSDGNIAVGTYTSISSEGNKIDLSQGHVGLDGISDDELDSMSPGEIGELAYENLKAASCGQPGVSTEFALDESTDIGEVLSGLIRKVGRPQA